MLVVPQTNFYAAAAKSQLIQDVWWGQHVHRMWWAKRYLSTGIRAELILWKSSIIVIINKRRIISFFLCAWLFGLSCLDCSYLKCGCLLIDIVWYFLLDFDWHLKPVALEQYLEIIIIITNNVVLILLLKQFEHSCIVNFNQNTIQNSLMTGK